jgi:hypothetical protein
MSLILSPGEKTGVSDQEYQKVLGDSPFSSGHPVLQKMNPRVTEIHIRLNQAVARIAIRSQSARNPCPFSDRRFTKKRPCP